ncbi:efflux RND transporter periplasmic adaptor subunit [Emcibacter sp. SYSU 3D8]|uniref:efflux RND transporter periplasmic adaptor subunit n=1 Tax=Emcibacter sp. SYSU 3D8 TaxID=3133969 RepID=UPI0031FE5C90
MLAGLILTALAIWLFAGGGESGRDQGRRRPPATVGTAEAALADMPVTLSQIGTVQPVVQATVRTQLAGVLFAIEFEEGQQVAKGQRLAQIDPRPYQLALSEAEGNLARDRAQLNAARVDLERYRTLLAQDSIAAQQVDTQAATVKQLEGTVEADAAQVGNARLNLSYTAITAPVSGKVGLRQADIGNYLTPGDANGIVVITQTSPIDVSFALPQDQVPAVQARLRDGAVLPVTAHDQNGDTVLAKGQFLTFDNVSDIATGTVKAKARFANAEGNLFPNQFVNVTLRVDTLKQAVTVPVTAVRHGSRGDFVFILTPEKTARLQVVELGPSDGTRSVVTSGVKAGDTVITEGADRIDDGASVNLPGERRADGNTGERPRRDDGGKPRSRDRKAP